MCDDEVTAFIKKDETIQTYGTFLLDGKGAKAGESIRGKIRVLGRLAVEVNKNNNFQMSMADLIDPKYCDILISTTKSMAGYC